MARRKAQATAPCPHERHVLSSECCCCTEDTPCHNAGNNAWNVLEEIDPGLFGTKFGYTRCRRRSLSIVTALEIDEFVDDESGLESTTIKSQVDSA